MHTHYIFIHLISSSAAASRMGSSLDATGQRGQRQHQRIEDALARTRAGDFVGIVRGHCAAALCIHWTPCAYVVRHSRLSMMAYGVRVRMRACVF